MPAANPTTNAIIVSILALYICKSLPKPIWNHPPEEAEYLIFVVYNHASFAGKDGLDNLLCHIVLL